MISPEQLAEALQRLDPRDRELLSLSLHRRVPDEALARMYDYEPAEVSRRRARRSSGSPTTCASSAGRTSARC